MWRINVILTSHLSFTNLKCEMIDRTFGNFEMCRIKAVNRTHKYIDINLKLYILPINNIMIKLDSKRYTNGYRPFFMSLTFDFCKYLKNPNQRSMIFLKEIHSTFINASNLNHTCPYNNDITVNKFWTGNLERAFLRYLPVPNGDYAIFSTWYSSNVPRLLVNTFFQIKN
uniref:Uncharacterized protein n=1 Tax=Drosophila melanogaster TaxID=7227 RepID=Q4ABJ3_DROME|nr:uncharacterized protein Dmel_CG33687 [Drosophila melanogaster]AAZ66062.2 uncharacterized protein Dmel_CG33687 [Drosophila melanogaster]|eukprot:NP_001027130.2 uncharacterized protein Dmel_CG33687 [Drosophila melanogaster]